MNSRYSLARSLILIVAVFLAILAFPNTLYARAVPVVEHISVKIVDQSRLAVRQHNFTLSNGRREFRDMRSLLLDDDVRVHAATVLTRDPVIRKSAEATRVPLRLVVITAPVILDA